MPACNWWRQHVGGEMLEKLREKHHQTWMSQQNHREFLEADDIGTRLALADGADGGEDAP